MTTPRSEFDQAIWKDRNYWSPDYSSGSEPVSEQDERTRNAETVRDALLGKPETDWNGGTFGDCDCDYTEAEIDAANVFPDLQDEAGVRYANPEEVQRYYDQLRPLDIQIVREDDDH